MRVDDRKVPLRDAPEQLLAEAPGDREATSPKGLARVAGARALLDQDDLEQQVAPDRQDAGLLDTGPWNGRNVRRDKSR